MELDYEKLVELARGGDAEETEETIRDALRQVPLHHSNVRARLHHAAGIIRFRVGDYKGACIDHAVAHDEWTMSVPPRFRAENILAWFYATRMAGRHMGVNQRLKMVMQNRSLSFRQKAVAVAAYCGGKWICKQIWPFHPVVQ